MLDYITNNISTIVIATIVFAGLAAIMVKIIKDKINHKSSCACGCANCPSSGICHRAQE